MNTTTTTLCCIMLLVITAHHVLSVLLRFAPHLVDAVDVFNNTPLMWAVRFDRRDVAKMLLRAGADVQKKNVIGRTVFDWARSVIIVKR